MALLAFFPSFCLAFFMIAAPVSSRVALNSCGNNRIIASNSQVSGSRLTHFCYYTDCNYILRVLIDLTHLWSLFI